MKCFSIKAGEIVVGVPDTLPHHPKVIIKKGMIINAQAELEIIDDDDDFQDMLTDDLSSASELAYFELVKSPAKSKDKYILLAYNPQEYRLAREYGDNSDILYRSPDIFVVRAPFKKCCLFPRASTGYCFRIPKDALVRELADTKKRQALDRFQIEERRKACTTVYRF